MKKVGLVRGEVFLNSRNIRAIALYIIIGIFIFYAMSLLSDMRGSSKKMLFSEFIELVNMGRVEKVKIDGSTIIGDTYDGTPFITYAPSDYEGLSKLLLEKNVLLEAEPPSRTPWWSLLWQILPFIALIGLWIFMVQQMQGSGNRALSFGKSRAKLMSANQQKITFDDVAALDEAKQELQEIVEFLKAPKKFQKVGAKIPKGVLLFGAPGTGKTLLARAIAGEAGVPFFSISGSDFVEMFVGVGASRVRDLFDQAKKNSPCIVFVDELDAVGRHRGAGLGGGHDEREQTLNQLLVEMDGFDPNEGVIIVAATNRPDILDPALLRPGRFDRHIVVDKPDLNGREAILKVHSRNKPLDEDVDLRVLARRTPGFVGSDLENLLNEAAILTARVGKERIGMEECEEAIDRVIAGPERKSRIISDREKEIVAYHECGHAMVAKLLPNTDPVHKISIIPRGAHALGYTLQLPIEDRYLASKSELMDSISVLLGGRAAEDLMFHEITTGAEDDLKKATETAHRMVCEYGMSEELGPLTLGRKEEQVFLGRDIVRDKNYSDKIAYMIDSEIRKIINTCYQKATTLLRENRAKLESLSRLLLEREVIEGSELEALLNGTLATVS